MKWLIYGANGFTAGLIITEAQKRGLIPILAGRNEMKIVELANKHNLEYRVFDLENVSIIAEHLTDIEVVLNCAGPYRYTAYPVIEACIQSNTHYVDITGELEIFQYCHQHQKELEDAHIAAIPGAGFDIVPTDVLSKLVKEKFPTAQGIKIAIHSEGKASKGTTKTAFMHLFESGYVRHDDKLKAVPIPYKVQNFTFDLGKSKDEKKYKKRLCLTMPLPDVFTASISSGFKEVEIYSSMPPKQIKQIRRLQLFKWVLRIKFVQKFMQNTLDKKVQDPDDEFRANTRSYVVGEAYKDDLRDKPFGKLQVTTINSYDLTAITAVDAVDYLLKNGKSCRGFYTPVMLLGTQFFLDIDGIELQEMQIPK